MQVAAGADRVAGFADRADPLPRPDPLAAADRRRPDQVRVEVAAGFALAVDFEEVPVEDRVVAAADDLAGRRRDQPRPAGGGDVEAFVDAAAVAASVVFADRAADAVRRLDRKDVAVVGEAAVAGGDLSRGGCREGGEEGEGYEAGALQWCSMTRSTMWYSFASSALMK